MRPVCAGKTEKGKDRWFESTARRLLAHTAPCRPMLLHRNLSCLLWTLRDAIRWPAVDGSGPVNQHLPTLNGVVLQISRGPMFLIVSWDEHDQSCCGSRNAEWLTDSQLHHSGPIIDKA